MKNTQRNSNTKCRIERQWKKDSCWDPSPPFAFICSISKSKKSPFPHFKGPLPSAPPPKRSVPASSSGPVWDIRTRSLETLTGHET